MCDQTEVQYLPGEVVWVKLRALWWPGQVQDYNSLPEEITCSLRKRPIAIVKFFQEDSYEYVHKLDVIYHYNCSRKLDFIKKGLDLCRKKTADRPATMDFFPGDVITAEELTGGDPNILQNETFKPEEKPKYGSLFGDKKKFGKKKGKEDSPLKDKSARRKKLASKLQSLGWLTRGVTANIIYPSPDIPRIVTHRRFINKVRNPDAKSDYEVRIMEQKCEDEPSSLSDKKYECVLCGYITCRLNVIVMHFNTTHSRRAKNIFPTPSILKSGSFRTPLLKLRGELLKSESGKSSVHSRKRVSMKVKAEKIKHEDSDGEPSEEEIIKPQLVKKEKGRPGRKRKVKPETKEPDESEESAKKPKVLDSLLADWEEDADQEEEEPDLEKQREDDKENSDIDADETNADDTASAGGSSIAADTSASKSKVFEFDDEDDDIEFDLTPSVKGFGRRIPRVIESSKDKKLAAPESKKSGRPKISEKEKEESIDDFESLLAETSVPSLPAVPKSSNFSLDVDDDLSVKSHTHIEESGPKPVLKEQNEVSKTAMHEKGESGEEKFEKSKNFEPEVELAVDTEIPPQGHDDIHTAKVTVQMVEELAVSGSGIHEESVPSVKEALKGDSKAGPSTSGDHTYVSGSSGRKRRRSLLPLDKNEGSLDIMSMPVVLDEDFMIEESPRVNKQPALPQVVGSKVINQATPRRVGRPPKKGGPGSRGGKGAKHLKISSSEKNPKNPSSQSSKSPPSLQKSKSPPPLQKSKSPPPVQSPKSPPSVQIPKSPPPVQSPKSPPPVQSPKSPPPVQSPKSPPPHQSPKSPSRYQSSKSPPPHQSPKSPLPQPSPKSPPPEPILKTSDETTKSPSQQDSSRSPAHLSPKRQQVLQSPKSPLQHSMSAEVQAGPKSPQQPPRSPQCALSPRSPQPYQSPTHQSPKSPQGLQSPKHSTMTIQTVMSPKSPKSPARVVVETKTLKSPPLSPIKAFSGDLQSATTLPDSKSPVAVKSPPVPQATLLSQSSPCKTTVTPSSPLAKAGAGLKKVNTSSAVIVQSKPDLQPEACGIGKIMSSPISSVASSSSGTLKTIKVAVSGTPGSSPMVIGKSGTPGTPTRKLIMVQGKGGQQKMLLPTEASQQLLMQNIGSGKKIMVITKGSSGKFMLSPQQQKMLAAGGKVTTPSGQVITSKGAVLSNVAKLVTSKPTTPGSSPSTSGAELSTEPPALIKTDGKKTYKIIRTPQSKGNILLNTPGGQILVPVSSIAASGSGVTTSSGTKQFILPVGSKNMKLLNSAGGTGQKIILQMKSSPAKATLPSSPKTVQPIVPKTVVQSITPMNVQPITTKTVQSITPKNIQPITSKTVVPISPKTGQPITPKTSQAVKVTSIATPLQPVPPLQPVSTPSKVGRPKLMKVGVPKPAKSPAQPKPPRKGSAQAKAVAQAAIAAVSSAAPVMLSSTSPQKRNSGIVPNPNLKPIVSQVKQQTKKISLAVKPTAVETSSVAVAPMPGTVQVVTSTVPALEQIQTALVPSVETSNTVALPTSTQQLVALPTEDGGQVMYLIDNSSLIGLDGSNQANLGNLILTFDNLGQPSVSSAASDFTFTTPSSGQDILAEALANTQVLQSEASGSELGLDTSGLLSSHANSAMYAPSLSHGVLETSLTLNQPIMTPLEDLSAVSALQPPPTSGVVTSVELPITIAQPDITISTSSYASLPIPSATIQSTVFSEAQHVSTFCTTGSGAGSVFIETPVSEGESFLTTDSVYEQSSEAASMPLLDG